MTLNNLLLNDRLLWKSEVPWHQLCANDKSWVKKSRYRYSYFQFLGKKLYTENYMNDESNWYIYTNEHTWIKLFSTKAETYFPELVNTNSF